MRSSRPRRLWWLLVLVPLAAPLGWMTLNHLESQNTFCNACHLSSGKPLHQKKLRVSQEAPPIDLSGVHFQRNRHPFLCVDCHNGGSTAERFQVLRLSSWNTLRFLAGDFQEPETLSAPLSNATCRRCHQVDTARKDPERFHGFPAHQNVEVVACTACHRAHAPGDTPSGQIALVGQETRRTCMRCHKANPLPPPHETLLQHYEARLNTPWVR